MKLIQVMAQYRKAVLRENAKLKSIYNQLIKEAEEEGFAEEELTKECDISEKENCEDEGCTDKVD